MFRVILNVLSKIYLRCSFSYIFSTFYLLRQKKVSEDLQPSVRVDVGVELDQGLGLVVGQPDGGDALQLHEGDGKMRNVISSQVQNCQRRKMTNFIR